MTLFDLDLQLFAEDTEALSESVSGEAAISPDEGDVDTGGETGTDDDGEVAIAEQQKKQTQTPEENAKFANKRREAERLKYKSEAEQAKRELASRDAWVEAQYGTSHGLRSWDDFQKAVAAEKQAQETQKLRDDGYTERDIQLWREVNALKQERETERQQAQQKKAYDAFAADHRALKEKYGDLVPDDVQTLDDGTLALMRQGIPLRMAWKEANEEKIAEHYRKGAKQQTLNNLAGKQHLRAEGNVGDELDATTVPPDTLRMYQAMNPKWSLKQIVTDYKKNNPKKGR